MNHDGRISKDELSIVLRAYKKEYAENSHLIDKLLVECDLNQDGEIDFDEFCQYLIDNPSP
jgi:Ca2+-binding EF-hand superfamily protein